MISPEPLRTASIVHLQQQQQQQQDKTHNGKEGS